MAQTRCSCVRPAIRWQADLGADAESKYTEFKARLFSVFPIVWIVVIFDVLVARWSGVDLMLSNPVAFCGVLFVAVFVVHIFVVTDKGVRHHRHVFSRWPRRTVLLCDIGLIAGLLGLFGAVLALS